MSQVSVRSWLPVLISLSSRLVIDFLRKGAVTSLAASELGFVGFLWILWLGECLECFMYV